jgi:AraC-like DNA-binding protein
MSSSSIRSFTDPDDYGDAIRAAQVDLTIAERGDYTARVIRIDLNRLWMQRLSDSLPRILHASCVPERAIFTFASMDTLDFVMNGTAVPFGTIVRHSSGDDFYQRSSGATLLAAMSLPIEDMESTIAAIVGSNLTPPRDTQVVKPSQSAMATLQRLHAAAGHLAETAPEIIAQPEAAYGLEQALIEAMAGCLSSGNTIEDRSAQRRHALIMRRFHAMIEEHIDQALYVPEICRAIGVSERTLRTCCLEELGMSPKYYLLNRRMRFARRDLRRAGPTATTVTEVATRYGFWHFGRFASVYKQLFDELPSGTIRLPPE